MTPYTPAIPTSWPTAHGWLYSWVQTEAPGYRKVDLNGTVYTATASHLRWDLYLADLSALLTAAPEAWAVAQDSTGKVTLGGDAADLTWTDRAGWLMGFGREAGSGESAITQTVSRYVPPGGIPCLGVTWDAIDIERDRELVLDRSRRQQGYAFGGCRVWRVRATMTRYALEALNTGWCLRGKITALGSNAAAIAPGEPTGALTGYVLGLESVGWLDPDGQQSTAVVTLLVATTTA